MELKSLGEKKREGEDRGRRKEDGGRGVNLSYLGGQFISIGSE